MQFLGEPGLTCFPLFSFFIYFIQYILFFPSVLWHYWLGDRKGIRPVKHCMLVVDGNDLTGALHVL